MKTYRVTYETKSGMEISIPVEAVAPRHAELIVKGCEPKPHKFISVEEEK